MGRLLQLLLENRREEILRMLNLLIIIAVTAGVQAAPEGGYFAYGHHQDHCHTEYSVHVEESCHVEVDQECHEEYDTVVDTTYMEECQDILTKHCHQTSQQVHHSAAVVAHDSHVVPHPGRNKREADPQYGQDHHNNKECFSTPHKQCHQRPVQSQRQECHEEYDVVVDTTYIEECQDIITTHCEETSQQVHHSSAVVGHDSQVVAHGHAGYGYGKREAEAEPGYSTVPQCHDKKDRQCHKKPVQNERKVPRPVCKTIVDTTNIEECEEIFTTQCQTSHTQVHHTADLVGHHTEQHREKREAQAVQGYVDEPQCHARTDRQCHQKPVQTSHQVPRQVCVPVHRQVCVPHEVRTPYQVCGHSHVQVEQYANDLVHLHLH